MNTIECAFIGRLGGEPELRTSQAGKPWLSFVAAVGNDDDVQWVRVAVFGSRAEELCPTLHKGDRVYCEGRVKINTWTSRAGERKAGLQVAAWHCDVLGQIGSRKSKRPKRSAAAGDAGESTTPAHDWQRPLSSPDDQIPFAPEVR